MDKTHRKRSYTAVEVRNLIDQARDSDEDDSDDFDIASSSEDEQANDNADGDNDDDETLVQHVDSDMWHRANNENAAIPGFIGRNGVAGTGITVDVSGYEPFDYFKLFLNDDLISLMTTETNRYAQYLLQQPNLHPHSRLHKWHPTTNDEMTVFIGLLLLVSLNRKPEMQMYWMKEPLLSSPIFRAVMLRERFLILLCCWHFCDSSAAPSLSLIHI